MASFEVMQDVEARLAANWAYTPIVTPNTGGGAPADNTAFLVLTYPVSTEEPISIGAPGANFHREEGAFHICLQIPIGTSINTPIAWGDRISALMAVFRYVKFGVVETIGFEGPNIDDESDQGGYFELSFAVGYQTFRQG